MVAGFCPLHPSLRQAFCSHCDGSAPGTPSNPKYSLKPAITDVRFGELVEILKNGGPVHRFDRHFRFGRRKASLFLAAMAAIREFAWIPDADRFAYWHPPILDQRLGQISVEIEVKPRFVRSTGERIDRPYLRLIGSDGALKGLGYQKCRAVSALRDELRRWCDACPTLGQAVIDFPLPIDDPRLPIQQLSIED